MDLSAEINAYRTMVAEAKAARDADGTVSVKGDALFAAVAAGDNSGLYALAGATAPAVNTEALDRLRGHHARTSAATPAASRPTAKLASDKQLAFIKKLADERDWLSIGVKERGQVELVRNGAVPTSKGASDLITHLLATVKADRPTVSVTIPVAAPTTAQLAEGLYVVGEDVYKLKTSKSSGHLYASKLIPATEKGKKGSWEYAPGATTLVASKGRVLDKEVAAELGHTTGWCAVCGAFLENKESVERGIGPICYSRL